MYKYSRLVFFNLVHFLATGYSRSDGACVMFLQRVDLAKRNYATILYADTMFNGKRDGTILDMDSEGFSEFLSKCYKKSGVNPHDVKYLETYGCGVKVGDIYIFILKLLILTVLCRSVLFLFPRLIYTISNSN